jgi:DNA-binding CsgD family transcriptional regulator
MTKLFDTNGWCAIYRVMFEAIENRICIDQLFSRAKLTERERRIIDWRFGLSEPKLILKECAAIEGCTRERVRQIQLRAIRKLKYVAGIKLKTEPPAPRPTPELRPEPLEWPEFVPFKDNGGDETMLRCDRCGILSGPLVSLRSSHRVLRLEAELSKQKAMQRGWYCTATTDICPDCIPGNEPTPTPAVSPHPQSPTPAAAVAA